MPNRLLGWALRRQGPDRLPLTLAPRRIYILPTRTGWTFALLLVAMFIAGINYGNGLAQLLTFWLTGFALVAMIRTQRGLAATTLTAASAQAAFAGGVIELTLRFESSLSARDLQLSTAADPAAAHPAAAVGQQSVLLRFPAGRRGRWRAPVLRLQSQAPFGLFRTWCWLQLPVETLVYPQASGRLPLPEAPGADAGAHRHTSGQDELAWLRDFREGDSPRQIAWKAYAHGAPLLVREYHGHAAASRVFDYAALPDLDREGRLSQLTRWIVDSSAQGQTWTLRLPGSVPLTGVDAQHRRRCLELLALFEAAP